MLPQSVPVRAHRAPDPAPPEDPLPDPNESPHPHHPPVQVPENEDPVPDHNPQIHITRRVRPRLT
jgi:hypothetical protein